MTDTAPIPVPSDKRALIGLNRLLLLLLIACVTAYFALKLGNSDIVRVVATENGVSRELPLRLPFEINTDKSSNSRLTITVRHYLSQNSALEVEMFDACIDRVTTQPQGVAAPIPAPMSAAQACGYALLNLSSRMMQGLNEVSFDLHSSEPQTTTVYISPCLFGFKNTSTLACLCVFIALSLVVFKIGRINGLGWGAAFTFMMGFAVYSTILFIRPNLAYSNDLPGHIAYTRHMLDYWMRPFDYEGWEYFHPPVFYFITSRIYGLFDGTGPVSPLSALRFFGLVLYMTYCLFGLRALTNVVGGKGSVYHAAALLIVLWPMAPILATRISNDIAIYTIWAVMFYYMERWYRERDLGSLQKAIVCVGVAFTIKSSAIVPMAVLGTTVLYALFSRRLAFLDLFRFKTLLAYFAVVCGLLINVSRLIYTTLLHKPEVIHSYYGEPGSDFLPWTHYVGFSLRDYIAHPFVTWQSEPSFLNYFLKSMLYGEQQMGEQVLPGMALNVLLLLILLFTVGGAIHAVSRGRKEGKIPQLAPHLIGVIVPYLATVAFMVDKHYVFCQSFRYVVPMAIPLVILFAAGLKALPLPLRALGILSAWAIACGGVMLHIWLYIHGDFG